MGSLFSRNLYSAVREKDASANKYNINAEGDLQRMYCGRSQGPLLSFKPQEWEDILVEALWDPDGGKGNGHSKQKGGVFHPEVKQPGAIQRNSSVWMSYKIGTEEN